MAHDGAPCKAQNIGNFLIGFASPDEVRDLQFGRSQTGVPGSRLSGKRRKDIVQICLNDIEEHLLPGIQFAGSQFFKVGIHQLFKIQHNVVSQIPLILFPLFPEHL